MRDSGFNDQIGFYRPYDLLRREDVLAEIQRRAQSIQNGTNISFRLAPSIQDLEAAANWLSCPMASISTTPSRLNFSYSFTTVSFESQYEPPNSLAVVPERAAWMSSKRSSTDQVKQVSRTIASVQFYFACSIDFGSATKAACGQVLRASRKVEASKSGIGILDELQHLFGRLAVQGSTGIFPSAGNRHLGNDVAGIDAFIDHVQADSKRRSFDDGPEIVMLASIMRSKLGCVFKKPIRGKERSGGRMIFGHQAKRPRSK